MKENVKEKVKELLKNKNNLIVLVLLGVLLFVITIPVSEDEESKDGLKDSKGDSIGSELTGDNSNILENTDSLYDYCIYMEEKLEKTLSMIEGAGKVKVLISIKASEEKVTLKDQAVSRSGTEEADSQGGNRKVNGFDSEETTIYVSQNGDSIPYVVKILQPQVEGVIVICAGAGTGSVSKNISDAIQALFGLDAHKITIVKMETP